MGVENRYVTVTIVEKKHKYFVISELRGEGILLITPIDI